MTFNISQDMKTGKWVVTHIKTKQRHIYNSLSMAHDYVCQQILKGAR